MIHNDCCSCKEAEIMRHLIEKQIEIKLREQIADDLMEKCTCSWECACGAMDFANIVIGKQ